MTRSAAQTGRYSPDNPEEGGTGVTMEKRLERLLKAELRKSRIPGWQEEERLPVDKVLGLMEKAYNMGKDDAQA
jgi:hypothetical protein